MTGFDPRHQTYARTAQSEEDRQDHEEAPSTELENLEDKVVAFLNSKTVNISKDEISVCHTLGKGRAGNPKNIVIRFNNRKSKINLLKQSTKLTMTDVFIQEMAKSL